MNTVTTQEIDIALEIGSKIADVLEQGHTQFFERNDALLAMATAIASGQHMIMFGKPGTSKTAMGDYFAQSLGWRYFYKQLTGATEEESLFGPISMSALNKDEWTRKWAGMATCHIAFCDEAGKASNLVQNSMLSAMQERRITLADTVYQMPLHTMISGSNETVDDNPAFYDRFTIRVHVQKIQDADNFINMLTGDLDPCNAHTDPQNLCTLRKVVSYMAKNVDVEIKRKIAQMWSTIANTSEHYISDRRWKSILHVAAGHALLRGGNGITVPDLHTAKWLLWENVDHISSIYAFIEKITDEDRVKLTEFSELLSELESSIAGIETPLSHKTQGEILHKATKAQRKMDKFTGKDWATLQSKAQEIIDTIMAMSEVEV